MRNRVKKASEAASGANSSLTGKLIDSFSNYSIVKSFAGADKERKILSVPREKRISTQMYSRYTMRLFWAVPGLLWDLLFGATILFCCLLYQRGEITVSEIVFTISVYLQVMGAVSNLINRFPDIIDRLAAAKKAYRELVVPLSIVDKEHAKKLKVNRGESVVIIGGSGTGKSVTLKCILGLLHPDKGEIKFNGFTPITDDMDMSRIYIHDDTKPQTINNIQVSTLDSFHFKNIGFIKVDVEGFEERVLRGSIITIISNNYPPILFECWEPGEWNMTTKKRDNLFHFLEDLGYKIFKNWGDHETHLAVHKTQLEK